MQLLKIADCFQSGDHLVMSGRFEAAPVSRTSEVKKLFGSVVLVRTPDGVVFEADVKDVAVSQSLAGLAQVTVAILGPSNVHDVPRGSIVMSVGSKTSIR